MSLSKSKVESDIACYPKEIPENGDTSKLLKLMECPVCQEVAKPPIFTCIGNHHMICADCRESLEKAECPLCHSAVSIQRCAFAEKAMEHIAIPCKYQSEGCNEILKGNLYRDHINNCPVRPVDCIISKCKEKVPFRSFFVHLLNNHKNKVNGIENAREHSIEWWIQGSPQNSARWPPYFLTCFNQVFLYMAISTSHGMWEWVWIIGSEEEAKRFRVISKHVGTENGIELEWRGPVHSIRKTIPEIVESGLCFVTNCKEIRNPFLYRKPDEPNYFYWRTEAKIIEDSPPYPNSQPYILTADLDKSITDFESSSPHAQDSTNTLKQKESIMESKSLKFVKEPQSEPNRVESKVEKSQRKPTIPEPKLELGKSKSKPSITEPKLESVKSKSKPSITESKLELEKSKSQPQSETNVPGTGKEALKQIELIVQGPCTTENTTIAQGASNTPPKTLELDNPEPVNVSLPSSDRKESVPKQRGRGINKASIPSLTSPEGPDKTTINVTSKIEVEVADEVPKLDEKVPCPNKAKCRQKSNVELANRESDMAAAKAGLEKSQTSVKSPTVKLSPSTSKSDKVQGQAEVEQMCHMVCFSKNDPAPPPPPTL